MSEQAGTTTKLFLPTLDLKMGRLRAGQAPDLSTIEYVVESTAFGHYLCYGILQEATQNGITLYERNAEGQKGDIHPRNEEITKGSAWETYMEELVRGEGQAFAYGWSVAALIGGDPPQSREDNEDEETGNEEREFPLLKIFGWQAGARAIINYPAGLDEGAKELFEVDNVELTMKISGQSQTFKRVVAKDELNKLYINQFHSHEHNRVIPPILPILRPLLELMSTSAQSGLWVRRVGSGIHLILVDESLLQTNKAGASGDTFPEEVEDWLDKLDQDSYFLAPAQVNGTPTQYQLYTGENGIDFGSAETVQMHRISVNTGVPTEKLKGEPTAFKSAEVHQTNFMIQLEAIQKSILKKVNWLLREVYGVTDAIAEFNSYEELTKTEQMDLVLKQISALVQIAGVMDRFGITPQAAVELIGMEIELDESMITEFKSRQEALTSQLTNNQDNADRDGDTDDEDDKPGKPTGIRERLKERFNSRKSDR